MTDSVAHLPPSRRKRLVKRAKVRPREIHVCGVVLREEPLLSPKLRLEKDTFSGGHNVTIRNRNERRRAEWHEQNDRVVRIAEHTDAIGYRHPMMILVPSHLWERTTEVVLPIRGTDD